MKTLFNDHYEFKMASHFACPLIVGDDDHLNDREHALLVSFEDQYAHVSSPKAFDSIDPDNTFFALCDVSGEFSECVTVRLYFHNPSIPEDEATA